MSKQQWAIEHKQPGTAVPTEQALLPYLKNNRFVVCPQGGKYTIGAVIQPAACSKHGSVDLSPPPTLDSGAR